VSSQQQQQQQSPRGGASFGQTVKAVAWSFVGMRKSSDMAQDMRLNPLHIVIAAFAGVLIFVLALVALVHWIV
jgi:amino acid transporter